MNIKITHSWLLEFLETKATPFEIQKYLSLCGPSIESVVKSGDDYIYDIEITSNRIDTASVVGIAREANAILNRFGIKSKLKNVTISNQDIKSPEINLEVYDDNKLCRRVVSVVMDNIEIKESPQYIKDRLSAVGIRSLNNIIDITNYVMIEYGHPTHVMDYDRIGTGKLFIRRAKKGEVLVTLDQKKHILDESDVVADDGTGRIVDLLGIMGCENSVVTKKTKKVVLFIESNNPQIIRHTSMRLGIRTVAAIYDEKQVDSELTRLALSRLIEMFEKLAGAKIASNLIDIYHNPKKPTVVEIKEVDIDRLIGVKIPTKLVIDILTNLGFELESNISNILRFKVPTYRSHDIIIKEDLIEEIARIYGYFNLPNNLQSMAYVKRAPEMEKIFAMQFKIKQFLKHLGLNEFLNYSMISEKQIVNLNLKTTDHLKLANTLSEDIKFLRITLVPSLLKNISDNQAKKEILKIFELSKVYLKSEKMLPTEILRLTIAVNTDFSDLKGIFEALLRELNIDNVSYTKSDINYFSNNYQSQVNAGDTTLGYLGKINKEVLNLFKIEKDVFIIDLDFETLINKSHLFPKYKATSSYAVIKLDTTIENKQARTYEWFCNKIKSSSRLLTALDYLSIYNNKISFRLYFSSSNRNITEKEAKEELSKILKELE